MRHSCLLKLEHVFFFFFISSLTEIIDEECLCYWKIKTGFQRPGPCTRIQTCLSSVSRASAAWAEPSRPSSSVLREVLLSLDLGGSTERALRSERRSNTRPRPPGSPPPVRRETQRSQSASISRTNNKKLSVSEVKILFTAKTLCKSSDAFPSLYVQ